MESTAIQNINKEALDVDHEKEVVENTEDDFLMFPFMGGVDIEKSTKELVLCRGTDTSLDKKHSKRITLYKCDREKLKPETYTNDNLITIECVG